MVCSHRWYDLSPAVVGMHDVGNHKGARFRLFETELLRRGKRPVPIRIVRGLQSLRVKSKRFSRPPSQPTARGQERLGRQDQSSVHATIAPNGQV